MSLAAAVRHFLADKRYQRTVEVGSGQSVANELVDFVCDFLASHWLRDQVCVQTRGVSRVWKGSGHLSLQIGRRVTGKVRSLHGESAGVEA